jgi:outer membrane protein assembly factor BamD
MKDRAVCQHKPFQSHRCGFPTVKRGIAAVTLALLTLFVTGCPSIWNVEPKEKVTSADQLFKIAEGHFQKKEYVKAIDAYESLLSAYPDFKEAPEVHLKIGDAFFNDGAYEKATAQYRKFVELYPAHKEIPRAKYQIAMGSFKQIKSTDLDSSVVQTSADEFKKLADDPNGGEWAEKSKEKERQCLQKLGQKELYKARTMISTGNYQAARLAARRVLDKFPKLGLDDEANELLKKIKNK